MFINYNVRLRDIFTTLDLPTSSTYTSAMEYYLTTESANAQRALTDILCARLTHGNSVLWLTSGGSAIPTTLAVIDSLRSAAIPLSRLTLALTDERYGERGHPDENWQQYLDLGLDTTDITSYRILRPNMSRQQTTDAYDAFLRQSFEDCDYTLGFFGIGDDGHTAGIKPHAIDMNTSRLVIDFTGDDFERITMTPHAISQLDLAIIQANSTNKRPALQQLISSDTDSSRQPAQSLKLAHHTILYTDQQLTPQEDSR